MFFPSVGDCGGIILFVVALFTAPSRLICEDGLDFGTYISHSSPRAMVIMRCGSESGFNIWHSVWTKSVTSSSLICSVQRRCKTEKVSVRIDDTLFLGFILSPIILFFCAWAMISLLLHVTTLFSYFIRASCALALCLTS